MIVVQVLWPHPPQTPEQASEIAEQAAPKAPKLHCKLNREIA